MEDYSPKIAANFSIAEQRERVTAIAHSYLGTKYHHCAKVKGHGVDCLTLLIGVYEEAGLIPVIPVPKYSPQWHLHHSEELYLEGLLKYTREVTVPKTGDIALWKFGRCFSHGAIVLEWPTIIHAYVGQRCTLENGEAEWLNFVGENTEDQGQRRQRKFFSYWK